MTTPDFNFSGFYYAEIRQALLNYLSRNVPEISNRSEFEPAVQLLSAFALVGHLNNTLLDLVAQESTLPTATLRDSVVDLLKLIGYEPHGDIPSTAVLRARLSQIVEQESTIVSAGAVFSTRQTANLPAIPFESVEAVTVTQSRSFTELHSFGFEGSRVDGTLNFPYSAVNGAGTEAPATFPVPREDEPNPINTGGIEPYVRLLLDSRFDKRAPSSALYYGSEVLFDTLSINLSSPANFGDNRLGYYGGPQWSLEYSANTLGQFTPSSVEVGDDGDLIFDVSDILPSRRSYSGEELIGSPLRSYDGLEMQVVFVDSGLTAWGYVEPAEYRIEFEGATGVITSTHRLRIKSFLGQASPSLDAGDYRVGSLWFPVETVEDGTLATRNFTHTQGYNLNEERELEVELDLLPSQLDDVTFVFTWTSGGSSRRASFNPKSGEVKGPIAGNPTYFVRREGSQNQLFTGALLRINFNEGAITAGTTVSISYSLGLLPMRQSGNITFPVPFDSERTWEAGALEDFIPPVYGETLGYTDGNGDPHSTYFPSPQSLGSTPLYWLRYRLAQFGSVQNFLRSDSDSTYQANELTDIVIDPDYAPPVFSASPSEGNQYVAFPVVQGRPISEVVGSSNGASFQEFILASSPVVDSSVQVFVNDSPWTLVEDFVSSTSTSSHYVVDTNSEGVATVRFGDGVTGRVPPLGANNIRASYRIEASDDGNVGAGSIVVNRSGMSRINSVTNPKSAIGWQPLEGGGGADDLERLKLDGVASLRTGKRVITLSDAETFALQFKDSRGASIISRARATSRPDQVNTVKLFVVGTAGEVLTSAQLLEIEAYFNGDTDTGGNNDGLMVVNQRLKCFNYTPAPLLDIVVEILGGNAETVRAGLLASISPLATGEDGEYLWDFNQTIYPSRIAKLVMDIDPSVFDVRVISPSEAVSPVLNGDASLPVISSIQVTNITL